MSETAAHHRPRYNCELRPDGSEDPAMAQWVEEWREFDGLLNEAAYLRRLLIALIDEERPA